MTSPDQQAAAPRAERRTSVRSVHGDDTTDDYAWLRDRTDPKVLEYLEAENAHTAAVLAGTADLQDAVFREIKAHTKETDLSVPYRKGAWWYYARTEEGRAYRVHCRRADDGSGTAPVEGADAEQVLLDENDLAEGHDYLALGVGDVSPDGTLLAYSVDVAGDEAYELRVRDLRTGADLDEAIPRTSYGLAWAADGLSFFYTTLDASQRPFRVHQHAVGTDHADDRLVFEETDERFFVGVAASRSGDLVVIEAGSDITSEVWLLDAHRPAGEPRLVEPRRQGVEYSVAHRGDELWITANDGAPNFAVWRAPLASPGRGSWVPVVPPDDEVRVEGCECFADHVLVHVRRNGVTHIRVLDPADGTWRELPRDEAVSTLSPQANEEYHTTTYRFGYQSMVTPYTVYEEDLASGGRRLLKRQPVLGGFDRDHYVTGRTWATADDGTRVPLSVVWRPSALGDGPAPLVLYGYGAYEASIDPSFSIPRLSLLDRGVVFAVAHVRGGGELGRHWYEEGKLADKANTFTDFLAAAHHLALPPDERPSHPADAGPPVPAVDPDRMAARGRSAGGLLVGAAVNLEPGLFRAVSAEVPFVDSLNTMLDPTLPLTVTEWEEWGNPVDDPEAYRTMKAYAPYENVAPVRYPAILALAGLNDPRVGFHEPAKWVAKLRAVAVGADDPEHPVLLRTELGAGHGGPSGRYDAWRDEARVLAFLLWQLGAG